MSLISILLALLAERFLPHMQPLREIDWLQRYQGWLEGHLPLAARHPALGLGLILLPPLVVLALLQTLIDDWLFGLLELLLATVVLYYSLRAAEVEEAVDRYVESREAGHDGDARHEAQRLVDDGLPEAVDDEVRAVADAVLLRACEKGFGALFWFVILGPVGALGYWMTVHVMQDARREAKPWQDWAERLHDLLAWAPAHLMAVGFVLTGSFEDGIRAWGAFWRESPQADVGESNRGVLLAVGRGALRAEEAETAAPMAEAGEMVADASLVRSARGLVLRTLVIWVAVVALMTLGGWIV